HVAHVDALAARLVDDVAGKALRELLEPDPRLEPREPRAEAEVDTLAEADVVGGRTVDVEAVRIRKAALAAVRGGDGEEDAIALPHAAAVELDVAGQRPCRVVRRSAVPEHLFEGVRNKGRVGEHPRILVAVASEEERRAREEPRRRLTPRGA